MSVPKDVSKFDATAFKTFLDSFDTVLCDCDGVLFLLHTAIEGTAEVLTKLKALGKRVRYVTNNCLRTRKKFTELMQGMGFNLEEEEIALPTMAIVDYLKSVGFEKKLFVLSFSGLKQELVDAGFKLADTGPSEVVEETKTILMTFYNKDPDVGAVIVDYDVNTSYLKLQKAVFYLKDPNVYFIVGAQDSIVPIGKDIHLIGPRNFQNAIKEVSGRDPILFGKPSRHLLEFINRKFNVNPSRTLFIGDSFGDMIFADDGGYQKMLVLSGVSKEEDLKNCADPKILPHYYLNSLSDLNRLLDQITSRTHL